MKIFPHAGLLGTNDFLELFHSWKNSCELFNQLFLEPPTWSPTQIKMLIFQPKWSANHHWFRRIHRRRENNEAGWFNDKKSKPILLYCFWYNREFNCLFQSSALITVKSSIIFIFFQRFPSLLILMNRWPPT